VTGEAFSHPVHILFFSPPPSSASDQSLGPTKLPLQAALWVTPDGDFWAIASLGGAEYYAMLMFPHVTTVTCYYEFPSILTLTPMSVYYSSYTCPGVVWNRPHGLTVLEPFLLLCLTCEFWVYLWRAILLNMRQQVSATLVGER
jgi:hypothetical protein